MKITWKLAVLVALAVPSSALSTAWSQEPTPAEPKPADTSPPSTLAVPEAVPVAGEAVPVAKPEAPKSRPLTLTVDLTTGGKLTGTLVDASPLPLKTSFGEVTVPLTEVAGIRFASKDDTVTTLVMLNGDSITGACDVSTLTVETEWGSAKINGSAIESLLFAPDLKWQSASGLSGKRWMLVDAKTAAPAATEAVTTTPATASPTPRTPPRSVLSEGTRPAGTPTPAPPRVINNP